MQRVATEAATMAEGSRAREARAGKAVDSLSQALTGQEEEPGTAATVGAATGALTGFSAGSIMGVALGWIIGFLMGVAFGLPRGEERGIEATWRG